ncbi:MAG: hypothetical protein ACR2G2_11185 [Pseudonocardia sp.]
MGTAESAKLLAVGATWRLTGIGAAGRALLAAVTSGGETERTLAAILLVKASDRSVPVVARAVLAGRATSELIDVLASINTAQARAALATVAEAAPPVVAPDTRAAAAAALRTLDEVRRQSGDR